jgi:enhancing lycopene biosynthesis protein 2
MMKGSGKTIGVVLSGCGVFDGAEIHEATITLLALDQAGADVVCMAPNVNQMHVVDHDAGQPAEGANRNVLTESARIARGEIRDMATVKTDELDGLVFPGGFGAAKNLSNFATDGANCTVHPVVDQLIKNMNLAKKPLGFICIAPAIAAKSLGEINPTLTIGNDLETAASLTALGANHVNCDVDDIVTDEPHKIVSTPAYMLGPSIAHVSRGIHKLVDKVLELS